MSDHFNNPAYIQYLIYKLVQAMWDHQDNNKMWLKLFCFKCKLRERLRVIKDSRNTPIQPNFEG